MASATIPLGAANIKQLTRNLKELSRKLKDDVKVDIEQKACAAIATIVQTNIASIPDVDGNYLGTDNPNASVTVEVALKGHEVIWRGKQITFVEFGTGAAGQGYPGVAMAQAGYHPDPTKRRWAYRDAKTGTIAISRGLAPQAPMLNAAVRARNSSIGKEATKTALKGVLTDAVTLR